MMKLVCAFFLVFAAKAFSADRNDAFNIVCRGMYSESAKSSCMETIKKFTYFNQGALNVCAKLTNDLNRPTCLMSAGDKNYEIYETEQCGSFDRDSLRISCLRENGSVVEKKPACLKKDNLVNLIKMAQDNLHEGDFSAVDSIHKTVLNLLENCDLQK